jgi:hypothetical protein
MIETMVPLSLDQPRELWLAEDLVASHHPDYLILGLSMDGGLHIDDAGSSRAALTRARAQERSGRGAAVWLRLSVAGVVRSSPRPLPGEARPPDGLPLPQEELLRDDGVLLRTLLTAPVGMLLTVALDGPGDSLYLSSIVGAQPPPEYSRAAVWQRVG